VEIPLTTLEIKRENPQQFGFGERPCGVEKDCQPSNQVMMATTMPVRATRCSRELVVDADLDTLATALYVRVDAPLKSVRERAPWRPKVGDRAVAV